MGLKVTPPLTLFKEWLTANPCPPDEDGAPCINSWIFDSVCACWRSSIKAKRVEEVIEPLLTRRQKGREIQNAIRTVYDKPYVSTHRSSGREPEAKYDPSKLEDRASRIDAEITRDWL